MPLCDLQKFLENSVHGACVPVDLLKIAKSVGYRRQARGGTRGPYSAAASPLTLVVDGECCLDRLYGGFFSDWVCGGQWNRMVQFLVVLIQTVQNNNIELAVFFNGSLEQQRLGEWAQIQSTNRKHINSVLRHVSVKGTPPPKVWWIAPTGLRMCLRMALRHLGIQVVCTMDDHHQEVIAFCRENGYHGLMAEDAEYIIFDPPRYFSSHQLKLTYKGSLETKEFILDEIEKGLNLPRSYFCFLATLLGNYLLTENDLADFYSTIIAGYNKEQNTQEDIIRAVVKFITNNCDVNNLMTIGAQVFGSVSDPRVAKFKESVQYFLNGTKDGFLQYKPVPPGRRDIGMSLSQYRNPDYHQFMSATNMRPGHLGSLHESRTLRRPSVPAVQEEETIIDVCKTTAEDIESTDKVNQSSEATEVPQIVIESTTPKSPKEGTHSGSGSLSPDVAQLEQALESRLGEFTIVVTSEDGVDDALAVESEKKKKLESDPAERNEDAKHTDQADPDHDSGGGCLSSAASGSPGASLLLSSSSSSSNSSATSPYRLTPDVAWSAQMNHTNQTTRGGESQINKKDVKGGRLTTDEFSPQINTSINPLPPVPHEVNRTASERHQKGLMSPWIYQVINQGEVKFEPSLQDEMCSEFPPAVIFFRPVRQYVYAILFNLHHHSFMARKAKEEGQKAASVPEIGIREWVYTKENPYRFSELTEALPINWAVPTVQRLWFGTIIDDKKRRLRAFLSCLHSDSPLMLHTAYVPQHMLVMATVLRFIMSRNEMPVLRRQEVDAFLVTAFSPDLTNAQYLQDLQIPSLNPRGVQLASFFMVGVEMAHFANDACGSPIPWLMCCPWNFFDGKLFHSILLKANCSRNLMEICDGDMELVNKVERCREAIFEGLNVKLLQCFSMPPAPGTAMSVQQQQQQQFSGAPPSYPYPNQNMRLKGRGHPGRGGGGIGRLYSRGGQLQVAGIVVGQWGPNFGTANSRHSQDGYTAGRDRYNSPMRMGKPSVRGRPSVLAKRRMIKRKDVRTPKGRPQQPLHPSHPVESSQIVEPPQPCQPTQSILQDYDSQADDGENFVTISHSQTNGGDYATYNYATDPNNETQLYAAHPENSDLAPFHSHPCNNNHNNNNGLKSPDSGVNVSILE